MAEAQRVLCVVLLPITLMGPLWANFTRANFNAEHFLQYRDCPGHILGIWYLKCFYKTMPDTFGYDSISIIELLFRITSGDF